MAQYDESELRIIEVKGSLPVPESRRPVPVIINRPAPTQTEALEALRSMKGAAAVIEHLPALVHPSPWHQTAFWSVNEAKGAAIDPYFWDCDFANNGFSLAFAHLNGVLKFWGTEFMETLDGPPPGTLTGQVWCDMDVQVKGHYLFAAQVGANGAPPDYVATVEFCLNDASLGERQLFASGPYVQYFALLLPPGRHRFIIRQKKGIFYFKTLTAWNIPVLQQ